jgi:hypothetical protein
MSGPGLTRVSKIAVDRIFKSDDGEFTLKELI